MYARAKVISKTLDDDLIARGVMPAIADSQCDKRSYISLRTMIICCRAADMSQTLMTGSIALEHSVMLCLLLASLRHTQRHHKYNERLLMYYSSSILQPVKTTAKAAAVVSKGNCMRDLYSTQAQQLHTATPL
eukprot:12562-Heterococcus_DN1.PRE.4